MKQIKSTSALCVLVTVVFTLGLVLGTYNGHSIGYNKGWCDGSADALQLVEAERLGYVQARKDYNAKLDSLIVEAENIMQAKKKLGL